MTTLLALIVGRGSADIQLRKPGEGSVNKRGSKEADLGLRPEKCGDPTPQTLRYVRRNAGIPLHRP